MSEKLKIVYRPLQKLSPYAHNARTHSPEQVAQLVESIKQFGWTNPVLIDEKGEIIAGHGRVMAAEVLKMDSVPVIVLSGLKEDQKKAYRLADNRLPLNAGWDEELLRMEVSELINADFDISLTGFSPTEIDELLMEVLPGTGTEEEPYTTKIDTPVYEPSGDKPDIGELYDNTKTQELVSRIRAASLDPDIEKFLLCAAERHTVFDFSRIADYYAHAPAEIQHLFPKVQVSGEWPDGGNTDIIQVQLSITAADEAPTITRKKASPAAVIAKASAEAIS
ncbi:TPA: ParB/Srx family N-terminal domain-containing protein [Escherichia coli]